MTLPYFLKDFAPPFLTDQHCLVAPHLGRGHLEPDGSGTYPLTAVFISFSFSFSFS